MKKVQIIMDELRDWSYKTFGNHKRTIPMLYHLKKETQELIEALEEFEKIRYDDSISVQEYDEKFDNVRMEFADNMILLLDAASDFNMDADQLFSNVKEKFEINKKRTWGKPDEKGVVEHVK